MRTPLIQTQVEQLQARLDAITTTMHGLLWIFIAQVVIIVAAVISVFLLDRRANRARQDWFAGYHTAWHAEHDVTQTLPQRSLSPAVKPEKPAKSSTGRHREPTAKELLAVERTLRHTLP